MLYHDLRYDERVELFAADADVFGQHEDPLCLWETADLQNHSTWKQHTSSVMQTHSLTPAQTWDTIIFSSEHNYFYHLSWYDGTGLRKSQCNPLYIPVKRFFLKDKNEHFFQQG